eukprot:TRINITY_DN7112_c0_g1_i1.p1 TRINITY_DN7112_c0_g1~~TRINITY_DN7112_c0_g1_i1.p1  ORF type:complete len:155 (+),score=24.57 TRINITY_DN7112_c0_g1_i1:44-508(+)
MTVRMVAIDGDKSTSLAVDRMMNDYTSEDTVYLCNIYSSWDYLNHEKNDGKIFLDQFSRLCHCMKVPVEEAYQLKSNNPQAEFIQEIQKKEVQVFYIGETAFSCITDEENYVFQLFSWIKKLVVGTMALYLQANAPCKIVVVPLLEKTTETREQ